MVAFGFVWFDWLALARLIVLVVCFGVMLCYLIIVNWYFLAFVCYCLIDFDFVDCVLVASFLILLAV